MGHLHVFFASCKVSPKNSHNIINVIFPKITKKSSPYSTAEHRVPELTPVLGSQPVGDVSHKPGVRLPLLSARPAVTLATLKKAANQFCCLVNRGTMGVDSLPKTVTRQHRGCNLNPSPTALENAKHSATEQPRLQN